MTEKFDIIEKVVYRYDSEMEQQEEIELNDPIFESMFIDTQDLTTINVSQPIKRIMKFYEITDGIPKSFEELDYSIMNDEQKTALDNFITANSI